MQCEYVTVTLLRRLVLCVVLVLFTMVTYIIGIDSYAYYMFERNFTYHTDAILEDLTGANTFLQCARRCSFYDICSAVEYEDTTTSCAILEFTTTTTTAENKSQYTKSQCDEGWTGFRKSCYWVSPSKQNRQTCMSICVGHESNLIAITSDIETEFLRWFRQQHDDHLWIGAMKQTTLGSDVAWDSGEMSDYTNWHPGQPNHYFGNDWCVSVLNIPPANGLTIPVPIRDIACAKNRQFESKFS